MITLIPTPKKIRENEGTFSLCGVSLSVADGADCRITREAAALSEKIRTVTGRIAALTCNLSADIIIRTADKVTAPDAPASYALSDVSRDAYTLTVSADGIILKGNTPAGTFYAMQTLAQLIDLFGADIPFVEIEDEPDFPVRGFYQDVTRGRVNKLEKLKSIVDMLAYYKCNMMQLYVEDSFMFREFEGIVDENSALTPAEMAELDDYCHDRFIELIPSLSTFGHMFTLLQSDRYRYLCELEIFEPKRNYWMEKQWHHTINAYHPDSAKVIASMIEQYIPLFRTNKFNICCDETLDLCSGVNRGKDKGEAYFHFVTQIIDVLKAHGKTPMMWGDEGMARPEMMKENVPEDTIVLNWCYRKEVPEWLPGFFTERGFASLVCPGTSSWSRFIEKIDTSVGNITTISGKAKEMGVLGILNTNWGDFGHICPFNCNLYGVLFGAQKSWNVCAPTEADFRLTASRLLYGIDEFDATELIRAVGLAEDTADWGRIVSWHSAVTFEEKPDEALTYGEEHTAEDAAANVRVCEDAAEKLRALVGKNGTVIGDLILSARAVALMNRYVLCVNGVEGYCDEKSLEADVEAWLADYSSAWLRDDKPSGLGRIKDFIRALMIVPQLKR